MGRGNSPRDGAWGDLARRLELQVDGMAGSLLRRAQATTADECESGRNEAGEGERVPAGLKREMRDMDRRCGQLSRRACARVSDGLRGGRS
jgi:hypothetical protein